MLPTTKKLHSLTLIAAALAFAFTACSDDTTGTNGEEESQLETHTVEDLDTGYGGRAAPNDTAYYSLRENSRVDKSDSTSTQWDVAFSGTTIYTNSGSSGPGDGGAVILDQAFDAIPMAPSGGYAIDTTATNLAIPKGDENGWYNYTSMDQNPHHTVLPMENKTIVLKTGDGQYYAKIRILSYYKGNPEIGEETPSGDITGFYTFDYAIQLNGSRELQ